MPRVHAYPPDLARFVVANWPSEAPLTLDSKQLEEALAIAYQASMTVEEARPTRFRLLLMSSDRLPENGAPGSGVLRLKFDQPRPLTALELRRLAPAAPFETSLIGAAADGSRFEIWGVAHSGPAWLAPTWGGRSVVPNWSYDPIVHVTAPGHLAVRCAGRLIGALERGLVVDATLDVFESSWLPALFQREREDIRAAHAAAQAGVAEPTTVEHSLVGKVSQQLLRRAIQLVRGERHGGLILITESSTANVSGLRGLRHKYQLLQDEPSHRFSSLLLSLLRAVAATTSKPSVGWADFAASEHPHLTELEQSVFEISRSLAHLTAIDGALVLDKRFGVLGFGVEVSAELPTPERVFRSLDAEAQTLQPEPLENVGTRHRAAYRFVNDHPGGLAVVISQDGGVTFVANRAGRVVFWEQSVSP